MGNNDLLVYAIWIFIFALIAIVNWVKKSVEKAQAEEGHRKKMDVGKSVRSELEKYMKAANQTPFGGGIFGGGGGTATTAPPPSPPASPHPAPPPARPAAKAPVRRLAPATPPRQARPAEEPAEKKEPDDYVHTIVAPSPKPIRPFSLSRESSTTSVQQLRRGRNLVQISRRNLRAAILFAEIMGPPVAERSDYRLF